MPQQNDMTQVLIERTAGDGAADDSGISLSESNQSNNSSVDVQSESGQNESDLETEEFAKMRCSSVQTEVISERRRRNPSAGYPGLAFGSSLFSSGTIMKFRVISNELHNIQNVQLKRVSHPSFPSILSFFPTFHSFYFKIHFIYFQKPLIFRKIIIKNNKIV